MSRRGGLADFGNSLILRGVDAIHEALFPAVQQSVQDLELFGRQLKLAVLLPVARLDQDSINSALCMFQTA